MKKVILATLFAALIPSALHGENFASNNSCSGLRQPAAADELQLRCDLLAKASENMRSHGGALSVEEAQPILEDSGIDPSQDASCWGLPFSTLGYAFRSQFNLIGYQQELGCAVQPDQTIYKTKWDSSADADNRCLVSISSDFDAFIIVEIDLSRDPAAFSVSTGNGPGGNVPQSLTVDGSFFIGDRSIGYAIRGEVAKQAVVAMLTGETVRNMPLGRTVQLGDFAKKLAAEVAQRQDCPGATPDFLPITASNSSAQDSDSAETSEPRRLSIVVDNKPLDWSASTGMVTYWVEISDEKAPKLTIHNPQCRFVVWLTNVVVDGNRPPVTAFLPSDSSLVAEAHELFEETFDFSANPMVIDAFKTTQVSSEQEAERLIEYYSEPKDKIELQLVIRKHWEDSGSCYADHTLEYVKPSPF